MSIPSFTQQQLIGVTAALMEQNGIRVFSENQIDEALAYLKTLEEAESGDTK